MRLIIAGVVIMVIVVFGFSLIDGGEQTPVEAGTVLLNPNADITGFARAYDVRDWQFPQDFGAHPDFQTEWWYYTGNLAAADGHRFGFQFTVFRRAITPTALTPTTDSEWRTNQVYMAHFAITDIDGGQFYHDSRLNRGGAELAGAVVDPNYRVWLENWQVVALDPTAQRTQLTADMGDAALDLIFDQSKPPALQGDRGLSAKSGEPGNASYYYSLSRLLTSGTVRIGDQTFTVTGSAWKDHEFSTSALGANGLGWDWFGLQFDDQRELMIGQIRLQEGGTDPYFGGLLVNADGTTHYLPADSFTITATSTWTSLYSGAVYPAGWDITVDLGDGEMLTFSVTPLLADQELHSAGIVYWEGAVSLSGDISGVGYAELTGYSDAMTGRF